MATPNYSYEKRQRELAKKRKKEEKLKKRTERSDTTPDHGTETSQQLGTVGEAVPPTGQTRP